MGRNTCTTAPFGESPVRSNQLSICTRCPGSTRYSASSRCARGAVWRTQSQAEGEPHEQNQAADFPAHSVLSGMKPCSMSGFTRARKPTVNPRMSPSIAAMKR